MAEAPFPGSGSRRGGKRWEKLQFRPQCGTMVIIAGDPVPRLPTEKTRMRILSYFKKQKRCDLVGLGALAATAIIQMIHVASLCSARRRALFGRGHHPRCGICALRTVLPGAPVCPCCGRGRPLPVSYCIAAAISPDLSPISRMPFRERSP